MNLKFNDFEFAHIGRTSSDGKSMWAQVKLGLKDTDRDLISRVEINLFVSKRPDVTLAELQREARDHAKTILREALACLEAHDITTLEDMDRKH